MGCTDEMITALPYFDLIAASRENRNLPCDIKSYSFGDGIIHLILPEDVPKKAVVVYIRDENGVYLGRRVYDFSKRVMIGPWEVQLGQHTLPTLYFGSDDPVVSAAMMASGEKEIISEGTVYVRAEGKDAKATAQDVTASLRGRGNGSWNVVCKKSYSLRLDKARNLLGLGSNRNWNLIGNAVDPSVLNNVTFNTVAHNAGIAFQPAMCNVNLYIDGVYQGVYTLSTKVTIDKKRIALKNGDYFYRMDPETQTQPILYDSTTWFDDGSGYPVADLIYPENAAPSVVNEAGVILQNFIDAVENPESGRLSEVCDVDSLARFYLVQEASMNFDAWERSTYLYYLESDGLIHMGPVWDMDLALGSPYEKEGLDFDTPIGWKIRNAGWYTRLYENETFRQAVLDAYYKGGVREALLDGVEEFEHQRSIMGEDAHLNYELFGGYNDYGKKKLYGDECAGYEEFTDSMIGFYRERLSWIDANISDFETTSP